MIQLKSTNTNTTERGNEMAFDKAQYNIDWKKQNTDQVVVRVPKGKKSELKEFAARQGKDMSRIVKDALYYYMDALGEDRIDLG